LWIVYIFSFKPYKEKYFNILALIDEVGVLVVIALYSNTTFINGSITLLTQEIVGYATGVIVEIVLILNLIFTSVYYKKRNPP